MTLRLGVFVMPEGRLAEPDGLRSFGRRAEDVGLAAIWMGEHVVWYDTYDSPWPYSEDGSFDPDPRREHLEIFDALTYVAACTDRIRLGTGITIVPQRNPVYTAKSVMTLDVLSAGRFDFGVGVGWNKAEFDATATPWARRGDRTDDYLSVMRTLWMDDPSSFQGEFYSLDPCHLHPKPVQRPHPPIHVSGHSPGALRRAATMGQGWYGWYTDPIETARIVERLEVSLTAQGRGLASMQISVTPPTALPLDEKALAAYEQAGVDVLLPYVEWPRHRQLSEVLDSVVAAHHSLSS